MSSYALVLQICISIMSVSTQKVKNMDEMKKVISISNDISNKVNKIDSNLGKMKNDIVTINDDLKEDILGEFNANFDEIKDEIQSDSALAASQFNINIQPNNFIFAKPTWGPAFAIKFTVVFHSLPMFNEVQSLLDFFTADQRLSENVRKIIPEISIANVVKNDGPTLTVSYLTGIEEFQLKTLRFPKIEAGKPYKVSINLKNNGNITHDDQHMNGTFYTTVNGKTDSFFVKQLFIFQTMGISAGAGSLTANATVSNFLFNDYLEDIILQKPTIIGTAPTWTDVYSTTIRASIKKLPDQTDGLQNLFKLITPNESSGNVSSLYNMRFSILDTLLPIVNVASSLFPLVADVERPGKGSGHKLCVKINSQSTGCDLSGDLKNRNPTITLQQYKTHDNKYQVSAIVDGVPLKTKSGMTYAENPYGKTFHNVKMGLKQPTDMAAQPAQNCRETENYEALGFFDGLSGIIEKVAPVVGDLAKVVVKHI